MNFEIIATGFDGSTTDTDDRVIWVKSQSRREIDLVLAYAGLLRLEVAELPADHTDSGLDFDLAEPDASEKLIEQLRHFAATPP